jgi:Arc/MetJ family transcription regulator
MGASSSDVQQLWDLTSSHLAPSAYDVYAEVNRYTREVSMRTNIVIDDRLLADAQRATGIKTKKQVVEEALRTLVRLHRQARVKAWRGKLRWVGDLDVMRTD